MLFFRPEDEKKRFRLQKPLCRCGPSWARTKDPLIMSQLL